MITPTELLKNARDIFARNAPNVYRSPLAYAATAACRNVRVTDPDACCFCGRGALLKAGYDAGLRNEGTTLTLTDSYSAPETYLIARTALDQAIAANGWNTVSASDAGLLKPEHFDAAIERLTSAGGA